MLLGGGGTLCFTLLSSTQAAQDRRDLTSVEKTTPQPHPEVFDDELIRETLLNVVLVIWIYKVL